MAQFSYDYAVKKEEEKSNNFEGRKFEFLGNYLKNDGDTVLVRFPYKSTADFKVYSLHNVSINGKFRNVACLRADDNEPVTNCPLCAKNDTPKLRFVLECIMYVQGQNGIEIIPCVWERPISFAKLVGERISDWGNSVFKIKRLGKSGDKKTTYDISPTNAQIYNEQTYPSDFSDFETFKPNNFVFLDRNFEELVEFVQTGNMPQRQKKEDNQEQPQQQMGVVQDLPQTNYNQQQYQQPQPQYHPQTNYSQGGHYQQNNFPSGDGNPFNTQSQNEQPQQPQPDQPQKRRYY